MDIAAVILLCAAVAAQIIADRTAVDPPETY